MQFNNLSECTRGCCTAARKKWGRKRGRSNPVHGGNIAREPRKTQGAARRAAPLYIYKAASHIAEPPGGPADAPDQARAFRTASPMPAVLTFVVPGSKMSAVRRPLASTRRTAASMRSACGARFSE